MYLRRTAMLASLLTMAVAVAAAADNPQLDDSLKTLATGDTASQLKATDDLVTLGPAAKPAVLYPKNVLSFLLLVLPRKVS